MLCLEDSKACENFNIYSICCHHFTHCINRPHVIYVISNQTTFRLLPVVLLLEAMSQYTSESQSVGCTSGSLAGVQPPKLYKDNCIEGAACPKASPTFPSSSSLTFRPSWYPTDSTRTAVCIFSCTDSFTSCLSGTYVVPTTEIDLCVLSSLLVPISWVSLKILIRHVLTGRRTFSLGQARPWKTRKPSRFKCTLLITGTQEGGLSQPGSRARTRPGRQGEDVCRHMDKRRAAGQGMRELGCVTAGWLK